ncbi:uncharacterized protein BP01DRAFT_360460 [Aspergillus saccharolyticus JOP 1030-1]|uniref:Uncharacterized protein n=1 Tax=Aspergillus saccharolyticus JOP 1030-1 TaxID=1450539 RepID=A0A318Z9F6_9EURO|nr:hypothetical protein BP01DRAFT_360460 [Aspergillus saccharolyticus JOP 1030-1]PYH41343.1 hypothetical protein BP01DRAFT_360460 [Aspergillus saccharolyticus JOP 1030-1]
MMIATHPTYHQQQQQPQSPTPPFAETQSRFSTPTRSSPLSPHRHHTLPALSSSPSSTASAMTTPNTPIATTRSNIFSSPLVNGTTTTNHNAAARTDPETPATSFLPSSPLSGRPSPYFFGSPIQKQPVVTTASPAPLFSFHPDNTFIPTNEEAVASGSPTSHNPSRFATRFASQIANPLTNAASRTNRTYTGTSVSPAARNTRRNAFLNRIKRDREDGRFENRGEQLVLLEHVAEQRRWGEAMRRSAVDEFEFAGGIGMDGQEDEAELPDEGEGGSDALDEYILELERDGAADAQGRFNAGEGSSFSDEEYDDIFMDLAGDTEVGMVHSQDMDMS